MVLAIALGIPCSVESFPLTHSLTTKSFFRHDSLARFMIPTTRCTRGTSRVMMAGFGAKPKEKPQATGAGKGQRAYERQVRSYKGLRAAGAEGLDVYVHRVGGDDMFIFAGKVAWSSEVSAEQALQVCPDRVSLRYVCKWMCVDTRVCSVGSIYCNSNCSICNVGLLPCSNMTFKL